MERERGLIELACIILPHLSVYLFENDLLGEVFKPFIRVWARRHPNFTPLQEPHTLEEAEEVLRFSRRNGHNLYMAATKLMGVPYMIAYLHLVLLFDPELTSMPDFDLYWRISVGAIALISFLLPLERAMESHDIRCGRWFRENDTHTVIEAAREYAVDYNMFQISLGREQKYV